MFNFFAEFRAYQQLGGPAYVSASANGVYYALLGIANERRGDEEWITVPKAILRARSGSGNDARTSFWRARKELVDKGFVEMKDIGKAGLRFRILGAANALSLMTDVSFPTETHGGTHDGTDGGTEEVCSTQEHMAEQTWNESETHGGTIVKRSGVADAPPVGITEGPYLTLPNLTNTLSPPSAETADGGAVPSQQEKDATFRSQAKELLERYPAEDRPVIDEAIRVIATTRKKGILAPSVVAGELRYWAEFPVGIVVAGLRSYAPHGRRDASKDERYARGCVRKAAQRVESGLPSEGRPNGNRRDGRDWVRAPNERSDADLKLDGYTPEQIAAVRRGLLPGQPGFPEPR